MLTDLERSNEAEAFLTPEVEQRHTVVDGQVVNGGAFRFRQAQYDYIQLYGWLQDALSFTDNSSVVAIGIRSRENRIRIGVTDLAAEATLRSRAAALQIPDDVLSFYGTETFVQTSDSLTTHVRPMRGGLQAFVHTSGPCSMGFNVNHETYSWGW